MPATVPACCGSKWRSRLICGRARDMFVRSMKAIVYMISATGIMRIQRIEACDGEVPVLASCCSAVVMRSLSLANVEGSTLQPGDGSAVQQSDSGVFARAVIRTHELRRPYSCNEGRRDSNGSVPAPKCPSLRGSLLESSPAKRNGRDPSVRKHPKLHRRPDKGAYAARRNSCHQPCLLPVQW